MAAIIRGRRLIEGRLLFEEIRYVIIEYVDKHGNKRKREKKKTRKQATNKRGST